MPVAEFITWITIYGVGGILGITAFLIFLNKSLIWVPYDHAAILISLEKRRRILTSGYHLIVPFVDRLVQHKWTTPIAEGKQAYLALYTNISLNPIWHNPPAYTFTLRNGAIIKVDFSYSSRLRDRSEETITRASLCNNLYFEFEQNVNRVAIAAIATCDNLAECRSGVARTIMTHPDIKAFGDNYGLDLVNIQLDNWADDPARLVASKQEQEAIATGKLWTTKTEREHQGSLMIQRHKMELEAKQMEAEAEKRKQQIAFEHRNKMELLKAESEHSYSTMKAKMDRLKDEAEAEAARRKIETDAEADRMMVKSNVDAKTIYETSMAYFRALKESVSGLKDNEAAAFTNALMFREIGEGRASLQYNFMPPFYQHPFAQPGISGGSNASGNWVPMINRAPEIGSGTRNH